MSFVKDIKIFTLMINILIFIDVIHSYGYNETVNKRPKLIDTCVKTGTNKKIISSILDSNVNVFILEDKFVRRLNICVKNEKEIQKIKKYTQEMKSEYKKGSVLFLKIENCDCSCELCKDRISFKHNKKNSVRSLLSLESDPSNKESTVEDENNIYDDFFKKMEVIYDAINDFQEEKHKILITLLEKTIYIFIYDTSINEMRISQKINCESHEVTPVDVFSYYLETNNYFPTSPANK
ncbi:hypothetical protein DMUE_4587 [Dictyocoela muelleri]|nr:hypothetical protein DMUE_4587 [Dictyocoela muelleri]